MSFFINLTNVEAAAGRSLYNMSYNLVMPFEGNFYGGNWIQWFDKNWGIVFYMVGAYMAVVFGVQAWMETRPPFDLRKQLFVWNVILAVFSLYGGIRSLQELIYVYTNFGLYSTYCLCGLRRFLSHLQPPPRRPTYPPLITPPPPPPPPRGEASRGSPKLHSATNRAADTLPTEPSPTAGQPLPLLFLLLLLLLLHTAL